MKWDMGWMNDTLRYINLDPVHRKFHHNQLTFRLIYAFQENFVLPLSHDEVVHGKSSILGRMPGDLWQKFANLRLLLAYQYANRARSCSLWEQSLDSGVNGLTTTSLDWHLLDLTSHQQVQRW
jgi:1,4-alpha-glucan branching enzyme